MDKIKSIAVALAKCSEYNSSCIREAVDRLFEVIGFRPGAGKRILVKPNLLTAIPPDYLACTHPSVVRAICEHLIDAGAKVQVGDSPTFGKAVDVAGKIGLTQALAHLPVTLVNLDRPKHVRLPFGALVPISRLVLESDLIVSVPKLKAHHQMRVTGAVKNVYGCVSGIRKPMLHFLHGDRGSRFEQMILEIWQKLPPSISLMDAVTAMHTHGPVKGEPYPLGLLAASSSPVALECAIDSIIGLEPSVVPLWHTAVKLNIPGARMEDLCFPLEAPESFHGRDFIVPDFLNCLSFRPEQIARNWIQRRKAAPQNR